MQVSDFKFDLPDHLIARYPLKKRTESKLLVLEGTTGTITHKHFYDLLDYLNKGDLMVFNNTKVIAARLFGHKATGGKVELLIERLLDSYKALAHIKASKALKETNVIDFGEGIQATMLARHDTLFELAFNQPILEVLEKVGHIPLPPYMERADELSDKQRYQTVYADKEGAVAAPTAGLHFDDALLEAIKHKGIETAFVTLHVGAGTFQPVRVDSIEKHHMHKEWLEVSPEVVQAVKECKARGGRVIAVGTTSVRSLETAALSGEIKPFTGDTDIFLYPGKVFHVVDALVTNFHLPESTLLMLVSAFVGYSETMGAYKIAVDNEYRFFSYGDAMFLTRNPKA